MRITRSRRGKLGAEAGYSKSGEYFEDVYMDRSDMGEIYVVIEVRPGADKDWRTDAEFCEAVARLAYAYVMCCKSLMNGQFRTVGCLHLQLHGSVVASEVALVENDRRSLRRSNTS